ncbi:K+-transporting ATPase KdpF subunit [Spirosoma lacussanchae]|nr:potassium-transporting ATPase subunit F [Spirosoma lacussanchae]
MVRTNLTVPPTTAIHWLKQAQRLASRVLAPSHTHTIMLTILFIISLLAFAYMLYVLIRPERF